MVNTAIQMKIKKRDLIKFIVTATLYSLLVIWFQFYWLFFGLLLIFDLYFTKHIKWRSFSSKLSFSKPLQELVDWIGAILVALVVVILIRTFLIEAYTIPTPSMENTLMVGDYLFVSKISYGPKLPNTPIAFPRSRPLNH